MLRWPWKKRERALPKSNTRTVPSDNTEPPAQPPVPIPTISLPEESSINEELDEPQSMGPQSQGQPEMRLNVPKQKHLRHQASSTSDYGSVTSQSHEVSSPVSESSSKRLRANSNLSSHSDGSSTTTYYSTQEGHSPTDSKRLPAKGSPVSPVFLSNEQDRLEQLEKKCQKYEEQLQDYAELKKRVCELESQLRQMLERKGDVTRSVTGEGEEKGDVEEKPCAVTTRLAEGTGENSTLKRERALQTHVKRKQPGGIQRRKTDTHLMMLEQRDQLRKKREIMKYFKRFTSCPEPSQLPNRACCREVILWLASKVSSWKFLGRWLGLEERDIQRIVTENPESVREQCYQMLVQWERLHPEMYSYCVLGEALVNDEENRSLYSQFVEEVEKREIIFSV